MADFLRGNVLGGGNRCRGGRPNVNERQNAYGMVPYWMGWEGVTPGPYVRAIGNRLAYSPQVQTFADPIYLTLTQKYYDGDTGQLVNTYEMTYDIGGNYTQSGGSWPDWVTNRVVVDSVSNPYTFAQAVNNAKALCAKVNLLDPESTYLMDGFSSACYPPPPVPNPIPVHFCYPSEQANYHISVTYPNYSSTFVRNLVNAVSNIFVYYGPTMAVIYSDFAAGATQYNNVWNGSAYLGADNGSMPLIDAFPYNGAKLYGWVIARKSANRHQSPFTARHDFLFDGTNRLTPVAPVNVPIGESIFTPDDVPGYGFSSWQTDSPPPLRTPAATADNATTTADDMNQTADSQ